MPEYYESIQSRIDLLNAEADKRSVIDSIDRPIRPLVIELNRIGLKTSFSCCGYTYDNQEEPKTHEANPYVLFRVDSEDVYSVKNFFKLSSVVRGFNWALNICDNGYEWCLIKVSDHLWNKSDNLKEAIHDYETKLVGIVGLTNVIKHLPSHPGEIVIVDGNVQRREKYGDEWVVKPKQVYSVDL